MENVEQYLEQISDILNEVAKNLDDVEIAYLCIQITQICHNTFNRSIKE